MAIERVTTCEYISEYEDTPCISFEKFLNEHGFWLADLDYLTTTETARKLLQKFALEDNAENLRFGSLFIWDSTPQGHIFWNNFSYKWIDYIHNARGRSISGYIKVTYFDPFKQNKRRFQKFAPADRKFFTNDALNEFNPEDI